MLDQFKPKQRQLIETARALFSTYGMRRVTVEEICGNANVSKATFYKYFKNKTAIAKTIIEVMSEEAFERYRSIMGQAVHFPEKAEKLVKMKMEQTEGMSQAFMHDLIQSGDPEIAALCQQKVEERFQMVTQDFIEAQKRGEIRQDIKPQFLLFMLYRLLDFVRDEHLSAFYDDTQELSVELTNFFFYGIMPRPEGEGEGE